MATDEESEGRVFPALEELVKAVDGAAGLRDKFVAGGKPISQLNGDIAWCLEVLCDDYDYTGKAVNENKNGNGQKNQTNGDDDSESELDEPTTLHILTPEARMTLRATLRRQTHFAAIIVARFTDEAELLTITNSFTKANSIYTDFAKFVKRNARKFPCLHAMWLTVDQGKQESKELRRRMEGEMFWENIIIH
jgi:hypothetical protein